MKIKLLLSIAVLFFVGLFAIPGYSQTQMISISNLKYTNGAAIPNGTSIKIAEGSTVSVTFDLSINNPQMALIKGGTLSVYSKLNSNSNIQHVSINFGQNAITGTVIRQCTIDLRPVNFPTGTGTIYAQFSPIDNSPILGTSIPVKVVPLITSNYIIGNQTVYEGDPVGSINGPVPNGGDGLYTYSWQQRIGSGGSWTAISGATGVTFKPVNVSASTISYRRIVTSLFGTLTSTSNEVTVTTLAAIPTIQNNTIELKGSIIKGSLPTGGTGSYQYSWMLWGAEDPYTFPNTGQNLELTEGIYNYLNSYPNFTIMRIVTSGTKSTGSNHVKLQPITLPVPEIQNNVISVNGYQVTGTTPTGGAGDYRYSWFLGSSSADPILFEETTKDLNLAIYPIVINILQTDPYSRLVRNVSSIKFSTSNAINLYGTSPLKKQTLKLQLESDLLTVYPNPTSESVNFSTNFSTNKEIEIVVYSDKLQNEKSVFKGTVTPNQVVNWNIPASYQKGIYFYKILSGNKEVKTGKIIVQ